MKKTYEVGRLFVGKEYFRVEAESYDEAAEMVDSNDKSIEWFAELEDHIENYPVELHDVTEVTDDKDKYPDKSDEQ